MKIITETERLIIREILPTDDDEMFELHSFVVSIPPLRQAPTRCAACKKTVL